MFGLYGVTTYSPIALYNQLEIYCKEHELRVAYCYLPDEHKSISDKWFCDTYKGNNILFFDKAENIRKLMGLLQRLPVVVVAYDGPLMLAQFSPIIYLDNCGIDHEFFLSNLSFRPFNSKLLQLKSFSGNHVAVTVRKFSIIDGLLQELETNTLYYYNTLTMVAVRPSYRHVVINYLLRYLFGEISSESCREAVLPLLLTKYKDYFANFEHYLASDTGRNLLTALQQIRNEFIMKNLQQANNREISAAIPFDNLATVYGIESYDLHYLALAYRKLHIKH